MKEYVLKSERVKKLRESALSKFPGVSVERGRLLTKAYKEHAGKSKYIVRAYAVKEILENMTIYIKDGELIVGNQSVDERTAPFFPEYAVDWIADELKEKEILIQGTEINFVYLKKKFRKCLKYVNGGKVKH